MISEDKKLLDLCLQALAKGQLDRDDKFKFSRDHRKYQNQELTFRELLESIRKPTGDLKIAMNSHYARSVYQRSFK